MKFGLFGAPISMFALVRLVGLSLTLASLTVASGCATTGVAGAAHPQDEAERRYLAAVDLLNNEAWPEAAEAFRVVQRSHATSRFATLAELRLADVDFKQDHFTEALTSYRSWLRYHPGHAEAAYARFMIARCHVEQMPDDWLLAPASWERDLSQAHDAETALSRFVRDHGSSEHAPEARRHLGHVREVLARHEVYVANFYGNRDHPNAAVSRLLGVLVNYGDTPLAPLALLRLGEVYLRTSRSAEARGAFTQLTETYASSSEAPAAVEYLRRLGSGPSVPVQSESAPTTPEEEGAVEDVVPSNGETQRPQ
jgi:outer membrane protein assembly factor BamD